MRLECGTCSTIFRIADEIVRGKVVRFRCKRCTSILEAHLPEPREQKRQSRKTGPQRSATQATLLDDRPMVGTDVPPPLPKSVWHLARGGERHGPFSLVELVLLIRRGLAGAEDLIWKKGMDTWQPIAFMKEVADALFEPKLSDQIPFRNPLFMEKDSPDAGLPQLRGEGAASTEFNPEAEQITLSNLPNPDIVKKAPSAMGAPATAAQERPTISELPIVKEVPIAKNGPTNMEVPVVKDAPSTKEASAPIADPAPPQSPVEAQARVGVQAVQLVTNTHGNEPSQITLLPQTAQMSAQGSSEASAQSQVAQIPRPMIVSCLDDIPAIYQKAPAPMNRWLPWVIVCGALAVCLVLALSFLLGRSDSLALASRSNLKSPAHPSTNKALSSIEEQTDKPKENAAIKDEHDPKQEAAVAMPVEKKPVPLKKVPRKARARVLDHQNTRPIAKRVKRYKGGSSSKLALTSLSKTSNRFRGSAVPKRDRAWGATLPGEKIPSDVGENKFLSKLKQKPEDAKTMLATEVYRRNKSTLIACQRLAERRGESIEDIYVQFKVQVEPHGLAKVSVNGKGISTRLASCFRSVARRWKFPETDVTYNTVFFHRN